MQGVFWLAEGVLVYQEGVFSMELVNYAEQQYNSYVLWSALRLSVIW
jgi:hypothetical protein